MKTVLFALAFLIATSAHAYTPTYGCFREHYSTSCSEREVICDANPGYATTNMYLFGYTVGAVCNNYVNAEINRREWIAYGTSCEKVAKKNISLVNRLRKACGAKCKRIK